MRLGDRRYLINVGVSDSYIKIRTLSQASSLDETRRISLPVYFGHAGGGHLLQQIRILYKAG